MQIVARHLAASIAMLSRADATRYQASPALPGARPPTAGCIVKHYNEDDSIFLEDAYLIKGIAGRIFWELVQDHVRLGRVDFTNKELRLDASLQLPDIKDNLEARLILLRRRLRDRCNFITLTQAGRGQFRLEVHRRLTLEEH